MLRKMLEAICLGLLLVASAAAQQFFDFSTKRSYDRFNDVSIVRKTVEITPKMVGSLTANEMMQLNKYIRDEIVMVDFIAQSKEGKTEYLFWLNLWGMQNADPLRDDKAAFLVDDTKRFTLPVVNAQSNFKSKVVLIEVDKANLDALLSAKKLEIRVLGKVY